MNKENKIIESRYYIYSIRKSKDSENTEISLIEFFTNFLLIAKIYLLFLKLKEKINKDKNLIKIELVDNFTLRIIQEYNFNS